jgi:hypothetical protein
MPKLNKLVKKAAKLAKKTGKRAWNDPEVKALVKSVASQTKSEVLRGVRGGLSSFSGGRITGNGDYKTSGNINGGGGASRRGNRVASSIVIEREEYVRPIVSSSTAKGDVILKFRVNPANRNLQPWGATVASGYESWEPLQYLVCYETTSVDALNSVDTSLGKVVLAAQYNTYARDWDSFNELTNANDKVLGKPSESLMLGLECKPSMRGAKTLYVSSTDPSTAGKAFYDLCDFYVAVTGMQGTSVRIGELKVRYKIRLFNPIVRDSEMKPMLVGTQATVTSTTEPLLASSTWTENLSTMYGGTVTNTATAVTFTFSPIPGRLRLDVDHLRYGASTARVGSAITVTAFSLGVSLTVTEDASLTVSGGITYVSPNATTTHMVSIGGYIIPQDADQVVVTWAAGTGASGDTVRVKILGTPYESSDF